MGSGITFLTLFNNKGGVGKTTLVYHLAWMFSMQGYAVLAADLDPQCNLTASFLTEEQIENAPKKSNIYEAVYPIFAGTGDITTPTPLKIQTRLAILPGDLRLSLVEDELSLSWPRAGNGEERSFRVLSACYRALLSAAENMGADLVLIDVGPNLGALNRTSIIASDYVITPLAPDMYSLQGLDNIGPTLRQWRTIWSRNKENCPLKDLPLPQGKMEPLGYIVMQHSERTGRPTQSYHKWIDRIPAVFHEKILEEQNCSLSVDADKFCLARLKHYRSLMPMAMEVQKPIFNLTSADGAFGSHAQAVVNCRDDFTKLVQKLVMRIGLSLDNE
ncbi:MAG: ParA family protein [Proteobacteria bacterium]|nr:ParA family protein [Pseudomonadota bacterium]